MFKKVLKFTAAAAGAALVLTGCSGSGGSDGGDDSFSVGFALKVQDAPYFVSLAEKVEELSQEKGWDITILDANGDTTKEAENIETFIAQGKDLIFVDAIEPDAVVPSIDAAAEAGIPVINLDSGVAEEANDVTTVYSDNKENGRLVGLEYAKKVGDEEIRSVLLSGAQGNVAGLERRTGLFAGIIEGKTGVDADAAWKAAEEFEQELSSKGKATNEDAKFSVLGQGWGAWTEAEGLNAAEDLLSANRDVTAILGENDDMLFGGMTAMESSGLKDLDIVAAADGAQRAMDLIKEGKYFGTGLNSPTLVAEKGVEIASQILVDGEDPESFDEITLTEPAAITAENVDEYYDLGF